jgi:hypothetical protein
VPQPVPVALNALRRLNLDLAFVQVRAAGTGWGTEDPAAADTDRVLLGRAGRRVLLLVP